MPDETKIYILQIESLPSPFRIAIYAARHYTIASILIYDGDDYEFENEHVSFVLVKTKLLPVYNESRMYFIE